MNLEESIKNLSSKHEAELISKYILNNKILFNELFNLMLRKENSIAFRAAWIFDFACEFEPQKGVEYLEKIVNTLSVNLAQGSIRSMLRILTRLEIPESLSGKLIEFCYTVLLNSDYPVAVKVHSTQIIFNISENIPELKAELAAVIEDQIPRNSIGFSSRGKKLLKKLYKNI